MLSSADIRLEEETDAGVLRMMTLTSLPERKPVICNLSRLQSCSLITFSATVTRRDIIRVRPPGGRSHRGNHRTTARQMMVNEIVSELTIFAMPSACRSGVVHCGAGGDARVAPYWVAVKEPPAAAENCNHYAAGTRNISITRHLMLIVTAHSLHQSGRSIWQSGRCPPVYAFIQRTFHDMRRGAVATVCMS